MGLDAYKDCWRLSEKISLGPGHGQPRHGFVDRVAERVVILEKGRVIEDSGRKGKAADEA